MTSHDKFSQKQISHMPLHDISEKIGTKGLIDRFHLEIAKLPSKDQAIINDAFLLAQELHKHDHRVAEPYFNHPLRVMLRILCHYEVTDANTLAAALLHDLVEDHKKELTGHKNATRQEALGIIASRFNDEVVEIVSAVTNPDFDPARDKTEQYIEHVQSLTNKNPKARIIKISDFTDNAVGIHWTPGKKAIKLSVKYYSTVKAIRELVEMEDTPLSASVKAKILNQLDLGEKRLEDRIPQD